MKGGIPRNSCGEEEEWKEKILVSSSKALTRFSSLYVSLSSKVDVAFTKSGTLNYSLYTLCTRAYNTCVLVYKYNFV